MKPTLWAVRQLVALVVLYVTLALPAGAQPVADHLKCYKVKDPQVKTTYSADLGGLVAEPGCTIRVPAIMACVPSSKTNVTPQPPGSGGSGTPNVFGCYKIKCPKATLPAIPLNDQFGARDVTPRAPRLLCAPAAPPPPTTTTTTTTAGTTCPPATAAYCGAADCGEGGIPSCDPLIHPLCPPGMTCTTMGATCGCTGPTIPCGDPRLSGASCNFCKWGTCPLGMTCGGVPKSGVCGFDCACQ
ncbi:MAG TPA: hypothetical protein VEM57_01550 [Candidatus Binatus sp.]|nr:hypothetical protein [Candidatus Binatus sp.]